MMTKKNKLVLVDGAAKDLVDINEVPDDWADVDLGLPEEFESRLAAQMRLSCAKEAKVLEWQLPAVRMSKPSEIDTVMHSLNLQRQIIARIDRLWPSAKAEAKRIGRIAATNEREQEALFLKKKEK